MNKKEKVEKVAEILHNSLREIANIENEYTGNYVSDYLGFEILSCLVGYVEYGQNVPDDLLDEILECYGGCFDDEDS